MAVTNLFFRKNKDNEEFGNARVEKEKEKEKEKKDVVDRFSIIFIVFV